MAETVTSPSTKKKSHSKSKEDLDKPWRVIVWNDYINTMSYVAYVFKRVLGLKEDEANKKMLEVHHKGSSCVAIVVREKAEFFWQRLQQHGLKVTIEQVD